MPALLDFWMMVRVFLIFMALVLPLQLGWAAAHGYAHDSQVHEHSSATTVSILESNTDESVTASVAVTETGCCGASHSCHGSPLLVSERESNSPVAAVRSWTASVQAFKARDNASRHERPQWAPA